MPMIYASQSYLAFGANVTYDKLSYKSMSNVELITF